MVSPAKPRLKECPEPTVRTGGAASTIWRIAASVAGRTTVRGVWWSTFDQLRKSLRRNRPSNGMYRPPVAR
jgi:hypothetical protein